MKAFVAFMILISGIAGVQAQTIWNVCVGEVFASGSCTGGVPHSNAGVFTPANLNISVGDRIRFYTRMELLGGYNGTHDIRFAGSPANNVLLPISTNILARVTNVTTPPFASAGNFPMECVDAGHCFNFADLFSGWPCNTYGVIVSGALPYFEKDLHLNRAENRMILSWDPVLPDANIFFVEQAGEDLEFTVIDSTADQNWMSPAPAKKSHYRIAALNASGDLAYTNVVTIDPAEGWAPETWPVPAREQLNISMATEAEKVTFSLADISGKIIFSETKEAEAFGLVEFSMDVSSMAAGIYFLKTSAASESWTQKVVITK